MVQTAQKSNTKSQFHIQLKTLGRDRAHPWTVVKVNNNQIYVYNLNDGALYRLKTRAPKPGENYVSQHGKNYAIWENGNKKYVFGTRYRNGFEKLTQHANDGDDIFIIPGYIPINDINDEIGIGRGFIAWQKVLFFETDKASLDEQRAKIEENKETFGLELSLQLFSGGSSIHGYIELSERLNDLELWSHLQKKLICLYESDPCIHNANREMRAAGFYRANKGKWQEIEAKSDHTYSVQGIESKIQSFFPYGLTEQRFKEYRRRGIETLSIPEEELKPRSKSTATTKNRRVGIVGDSSNDLFSAVEEAKARLSAEEIYNEFSHNWNYQVQAPLLSGECPQHQSDSGHSFKVKPETKSWYCWGCMQGGGPIQYLDFVQGGDGEPDGKRAIELAKYFCSKAGIAISEPSPYAKEGADRALFEKIGESPTDDPTQWLESALDNVLSNHIDSAQSFLASQQARSAIAQETGDIYAPVFTQAQANYRPGQLDEIKGPVIYNRGQRKQVWSEANAKSYKIVLDRSETGAGKTHDAVSCPTGIFDFGIDENGEQSYGQFFYSFSEPDDPPVDISDKIERLPTLNEDDCHKTPQRRTLAEKGLGKSNGKGKFDSNPICNQCPLLNDCRHDDGAGYGFKGKMRGALAAPKIYGHISGLPREDNRNTIAFIDEAGAQIPPVKSKSISLEQVTRAFIRLEQRDHLLDASEADLLYDDLKFLKQLLESYLSSAEQIPLYGLDFAKIKEHLPDWSQSKILETIELLDEVEQAWAKNDLKSIGKDSTAEDINHIVDQPWLGDVVSILFGYDSGALRLLRTADGNKLQIIQTNDEQINKLKSFRMAVLLDATLTKHDLIFEYGFSPDEVLEVYQLPTPTPNLKITQLTNAGLNTSQRSEAGQERKQQIVNRLKSQYGDDVGIVDYKRYSEEGDLHHFRSGEEGGRGSNRFKDKQAVVSVGTPYIAVNAALDTYQAISGEPVDSDRAKEHSGFSQYYNRLTQKQLIQELGRLRANLRSEQQLDFYLINDFDPSFLSELGLEVIRKPIWELVPELKPKLHERLEGLAVFFSNLFSHGQEITKAKQKRAAKAINCRSDVMSRIVKRLGGWIKLKQKIDTLFRSFKEQVNFSDATQLATSELFWEYGEELAKSEELLFEAIDQHGWQKFEEYFAKATATQKGQMLANLLANLFNGKQDWLHKLFDSLVVPFSLSETGIALKPVPW